MKVRVGTKQLIWHPEEDSDNDGYVKQESFVLSTSLATDEHGDPTDLPADGLLDYATDGATKRTATFHGIRKESQIEDA